MDRRSVRVLVMASLLAVVASCSPRQRTRPDAEPPPPVSISPTGITYVDSDAFDTVLESALVNQDPAIVIQTGHTKPDWGPRLNAWIAAWNMGGPADGRRRAARGQSPLTINGESIRELRLLVDDLMGKAETLAAKGSTWWAEERTRSRRVALLKPYSLRFHQGADKNIQLIFFHGAYAAQYRDFMATLADDGPADWARAVECSQCKQARAAQLKLVGNPPPQAKAAPEDE